MLNPLWLKTLIAIQETGSFTRAAERLDLTQAAVSQHIQRLEAECGPLLLRKPRQLELTPRGLRVLAYAREQQRASERLYAELSEDNPHAGEIRLSTPGSIGLFIYPWLLEQQQAHPTLSIQHRIAPATDIIRAVLEGRCDLGIVDQAPEHPSLHAEPFAREPLCLVVPASLTDISWSALLALGFIDHPDGRAMALRLLSRQFPGQHLDDIPVRGLTNQISLILEPVARGLGFTVLPRFAVIAFARPELVRVHHSESPVTDTLWAIHRAEWPLPARYQQLLNDIKIRGSDFSWLN
ncbi:LysR family transcriptional regulator [Edwardsiella piscicida]|nr:LysR family transcriptional regulator [Edwardsiella piscicida]ELM3656662.1 LysR family transcriptional regulator [Edwardsiella piscicida]ELM3727647.1 LysR family transcriptional regulator [Edwardsiella piscicida]ELV7535398.1 LysR family transcriptional regulator [Edwardsiella piscicida]